ncbi:MAG: hypothetical protein COB17_00790 [Sulfurimonas sp.]|nr:MAG: hypothetical protein COB17_00790 [Sulfurimonas sp.]
MENYMLVFRNRILDAVMVSKDRKEIEASTTYQTVIKIIDNYLIDEIEPSILELSVLSFIAEYYEGLS